MDRLRAKLKGRLWTTINTIAVAALVFTAFGGFVMDVAIGIFMMALYNAGVWFEHKFPDVRG
jgi:Sec-independent protein secretion pathway component TatC